MPHCGNLPRELRGRLCYPAGMDHISLSYQSILSDSAAYHIARGELSSGRQRQLHGHDFYELLWVQNGLVRQQFANGRQDLIEGSLVFVRPGQTHALQAMKEATLVVSLTIRPALIDAIGARYPEFAGHFFWAKTAIPETLHRDIRQFATLNQAALRLERSAPTALSLDAFVVPLLAGLLDEVAAIPTELPDWLASALSAAQDPKVFRDGAAGLVELTDRAHPHVSRTMKRFMGQTPSEYVNGIRMRYAARRLSGSEDPLPEIASEVGLSNLSHFHKLFRSYHGATPSAYRRKLQKNLIQPRENI